MRWLTLILLLMLAGLQWRVWFGDASVGNVREKEARLEALESDLRRLEMRNETLAAEVESLRQGVAAVEGQARLNLGFVYPDEHFFQVIEAVRPDTITPAQLGDTRVPDFVPDE